MSESADLIIQNAQVYTVDDNNPYAEAVAVKDNQIIFVGSNSDVQSYIGEGSQVIDGNGRSLLPGFIDSHFHLEWGAKTLQSAQLYDVRTVEVLKERIDAWKAENPNAPWVLGDGLTYSIPSKEEPLTRHILDQIESEKPLMLATYDQHSMFVNSVALSQLGLTNGCPDPLANGEVVVDAAGLATGELYELDAMNLVFQALPKPTDEQRLQILQEGLALCAKNGLTSIHNMDGDAEQARFYAALEDRDALTLRVYIPYWVKPGTTVSEMEETAVSMRDAHQTELLRSNCVKFFMDGVYESYTAVTTNGYPDQPDNLGEPIWDAQTFAQFATVADKLGLQIFVHACGDRAVKRVLDGYETAVKINGRRDSRHRVEHIEMIDLVDLPRFNELGIIASMQPIHAPLGVEFDPDIWLKRVRQTDYDRAFAWRTIRDAGIPLALGSDWPVVTLNPLLGIWGAVCRQPLGEHVISHKQTLAEAIRGYTIDGAYAEFQEDKKGQIKVGMWADLVLLSDDIFAVDPEQIREMDVAMTVVNGRIVHKEK